MSSEPLSPGATVSDRYRITSLLGRGGSGETYEAVIVATGASVALKRFRLKGADSWKSVELFEREARVLRGLAHPAIPRYVDSFNLEGPEGLELYLAQELAPGSSLASWIASGARADEAEARRVATEVLEILRYLHSQTPPVVHRDIKPANLVRAPDGRITLVDFGSVREVGADPAGGSTVTGTYGFMAPEQLRGIALPASDLHGLGATLVFLLSRKSLDELPQQRLKVSLPSDLGVGGPFRKWLERMLQPAPEDRFASAREALAALRDAARGGSSRRTIVLGATLAVVVAIAGGGVVVLQRALPVGPSGSGAEANAAAPSAPFPMLPELPRSRYLGVRFHKRVAAHVNAVQAIAFSPDGKRLVTASHDRTARVFDTDTWEMKLALPDHGGPVLGAAFTTDQRSIITAGGTSVFQWDAATGKPIRSVDTGVRSGAVGISPAGDSAWVAGWDGRIRSFKLPSLDPGPLLDASPDKGRVIAVGFSPNGKSFAAAGDDGHIRFWLPPDAKVVRDLPAHAGPVNKVRFNPEGTMFASAGDDGAVHLFHIDAPKPISTFRASQTEAWEAAFSPRSDLLITGDKNGLLGAWHLPGGNLAWRARPHEGRGIIQAQVSPDNEWLAVAMGNGAVEVYAIPPAGDAKAIPEPKPIRRARPEPTTLAQKAQRIVDDSITNPSLRVDEAGELAAKAIAENPKDALALVQAGRVARLRGYISGSRYQPAAIELAQQMSKRALEANPSLFEAKELAAWLALTEATNRPGPFEAADFDKARAAADVVVSADVTRLEGEVLHAVIANYEGSHEAAVVRATRVIQQSDDDRLIHMGYQELIEALTKLGRLDAADAAHQKLLAFSPQSAWIRGGYARFLLRRGKRDDAIEMAKKAIDLMNYPAAHHIIADALVDRGVQLLWDRGNVAEARKAFDAALTEEPGSADARYGVLACDAAEAEKRGTPCDSCELGLVQLLALDPKHEQALWVQKQLGRGAFSPRK